MNEGGLPALRHRAATGIDHQFFNQLSSAHMVLCLGSQMNIRDDASRWDIHALEACMRTTCITGYINVSARDRRHDFERCGIAKNFKHRFGENHRCRNTRTHSCTQVSLLSMSVVCERVISAAFDGIHAYSCEIFLIICKFINTCALSGICAQICVCV